MGIEGFVDITKCRLCGSKEILNVLSLGDQYLTGVFPKKIDEAITRGPLDLFWCTCCTLLQLKQSYSLSEMYGENYGYRSGLNKSMVRHLSQKIKSLEKIVSLKKNDIVIDIGSNDATSLRAYTSECRKVGIDPTALKFKSHYTDDIILVPEFFSKKVFRNIFPSEDVKLVTSIAMFYDLEDPNQFVSDIEAILASDGVWHFEQSYLPSMLRTNAYDAICHEHLEFYSFKVIKAILEKNGLRVLDVQLNSINGGSFAITACREKSEYTSNHTVIDWLLRQEEEMELNTLKPYEDFRNRVFQHRNSLRSLIKSLVSDGKKIIGYGASTKGNVLLQFCGLTNEDIICIAEVNEDKFGCYTPGSNIPIVSEAEARAMKPDYFLVLPWHFRDDILCREADYISKGGKFIFPLPEIEII